MEVLELYLILSENYKFFNYNPDYNFGLTRINQSITSSFYTNLLL